MTGRSHPLPPEFALLAACALLDDAPFAEVAAPLARRAGFDWDRFVELGLFHGVAQLALGRLERVVPGAVPPGPAARLRRLLVEGTALNAAQARSTVRLLDALERDGIPALVLKGVALAGQLYAPNPALRTSSDIDLLVAPGHMAAADAALRRAGLERTWPERDPPAAGRAMFLHLANVYEYRGPVLEALVELHCRATLNPHAMPVPFAELHAASVVVDTGHGAVRTLGGPLQVQYLCEHVLPQLPHRLKWFGDIARALRLAGASDCASYVASHPRPLPLGAARATGELLHDFESAIAAAADGRPSPARNRDFARIARVMERGEEFAVARTFARLPGELRQLGFVLKLAPGWRGKAYELLWALSDPRDAVTLRLGPRFAPAYAALGLPLSLLRFLKRARGGAEAQPQDRGDR